MLSFWRKNPLKQWLILLVSAVLAVGFNANAATASPDDERVCGIFSLETAMFDGWRAIANRGPSGRQVVGYEYEPLTLKASNRPVLVGYRLAAKKGSTASRALLVLQGNATRADQLHGVLVYFADRGFDVFIFDYRGYGKSGGDPLLKSISLDQSFIADFIRGRGYDQLFLYAISIGGVFALGPHMQLDSFKAVAIDSSPARLPWYAFCPPDYDPLVNLPPDASKIIVISGGRDTVVEASDVEPLGKAVKARGGEYRAEPNFGHPLMDGAQNTRTRFGIVADFFSIRD